MTSPLTQELRTLEARYADMIRALPTESDGAGRKAKQLPMATERAPLGPSDFNNRAA